MTGRRGTPEWELGRFSSAIALWLGLTVGAWAYWLHPLLAVGLVVAAFVLMVSVFYLLSDDAYDLVLGDDEPEGAS